MTSLLVELQTEELPPKALKKLSEAFASGVVKGLQSRHFIAGDAKFRGFGAPRRMAVLVEGVAARSPDEAFRQKLVPVRVGIGPDGAATPALAKKMAALGIDCGVSELKRVSDGKNEQLVYEGVRPGAPLAAGLQKALEEAVKALPIPKVMNYQLADGTTTVQFVRPVRNLVALHGGDVVPVRMFG
ncbi:MAG: glycine--tRNA ligase subunit beta, partial [Oscillospiraceae bacterium]|nr:glycine--tRNA ligase subunit beta [Oscillospiraceae bacterium]